MLGTALVFGAATSDRVNVGTGASLENHTTASYLTWVYPTTHTNFRRIYQKGTFSGGGARYFAFGGTTPSIYLEVDRGSTDMGIEVTLSNFANYRLNAWNCFACVHNTAGANGDQKMYCGNLTASLAEPSAYAVQRVGTGAVSNNTSTSAYIGNGPTTNAAFQGSIALLMIFNRVLSLGELQELQSLSRGFLSSPSLSPAQFSGCVGAWPLGLNGHGTQHDYSGQNNHGVITGAKMAYGPPLHNSDEDDEEWGDEVTAGGVLVQKRGQRTMRALLTR